MKPMLLSEYPDHIDLVNSQKYIFIQPKLDGFRAIGNTKTGEIISREGNSFVLPHISAELIELGKKGFPEWLDGELYKHGKTLGQIQSLIRKSSDEVEFHVFDFIGEGGFSNRFDKIIWTLAINFSTENIEFVETWRVETGIKECMRIYDQLLEAGYEGAVIRLDNRTYEQFRSNQALKMKPEIM
jgi:ATP-dependent DNA ligase